MFSASHLAPRENKLPTPDVQYVSVQAVFVVACTNVVPDLTKKKALFATCTSETTKIMPISCLIKSSALTPSCGTLVTRNKIEMRRGALFDRP